MNIFWMELGRRGLERIWCCVASPQSIRNAFSSSRSAILVTLRLRENMQGISQGTIEDIQGTFRNIQGTSETPSAPAAAKYLSHCA
jgi:hypothetical protein